MKDMTISRHAQYSNHFSNQSSGISSTNPNAWSAAGQLALSHSSQGINSGAQNDLFTGAVNTPARAKRNGDTDAAYVPINYWATANDANTVLETNRLTSCSALVVLTRQQADGTYANRTMVHLNGSSLNNRLNGGVDGYKLVDNLTKQINEAGGGKLIWASGPDNRNPSILTALGQEGSNGKGYPLAELMLNPGVSTDIVSTNEIAVSPDGSYTLGELGAGKLNSAEFLGILGEELTQNGVAVPSYTAQPEQDASASDGGVIEGEASASAELAEDAAEAPALLQDLEEIGELGRLFEI
ncbi:MULTISPECIES: hypothetical protein [Chelatococcus]|uniref:Uncharacterized protein n=1 Tax=Chelatococcus caeni TaxID=1348468 RepID=A0A840BRJ4_9HYPH|nr:MULTISPECIES: hypothetical protein [Chelatococcus]MBB4016061.1 hypothetical protein [Chelatococcus caeni]